MEGLQKLGLGTWKVRYKVHSFGGIVFMAIVMAVVYFGGDGEDLVGVGGGRKVEGSTMEEEGCDLFSGEWVFDNKSYPLYSGQKCPFMTDAYACEKFGRTELKFQQWRWQPLGCDLPRFNGTELLEKLRNKRVVFVGDSLGKNQYVSLVCMIDSWILDPKLKISEWHGSLITFKAIEYNASIDFYWEPLLVESNCDDPIIHRVHDRRIRVDSIENHAKHWIDADMLVFNSYMWWLEPNMTLSWGDSLENPNKTYVEPSPMRRFEMALKTWSTWLDIHVNRTKTRLFFTTLTPFHKMSYFWGDGMDKSCYNETEPILKNMYLRDVTDVAMMGVASAAIDDLRSRGVNVQVLNVTELSSYRKDGHPSVYRRYWEAPSKIETADPNKVADCVHWCLPGVPDVWNEIFYSFILQNSSNYNDTGIRYSPDGFLTGG